MYEDPFSSVFNESCILTDGVSDTKPNHGNGNPKESVNVTLGPISLIPKSPVSDNEKSVAFVESGESNSSMLLTPTTTSVIERILRFV